MSGHALVPPHRNAPLRLTAGCKVNLGLRITRVRPDGYHELDSLFLPLDEPADQLELTVLPDAAPGIDFHNDCSVDLPAEINRERERILIGDARFNRREFRREDLAAPERKSRRSGRQDGTEYGQYEQQFFHNPFAFRIITTSCQRITPPPSI